MVLSKPDILNYLREDRLRFTPEIEQEQVAQVSVDLRLGRRFSEFRDPPGYLSAIHVDPSLWGSADLWQHHEQDVFRLLPGRSVLAQTLERVYVPKTSWGWSRAEVATRGSGSPCT